MRLARRSLNARSHHVGDHEHDQMDFTQPPLYPPSLDHRRSAPDHHHHHHHHHPQPALGPSHPPYTPTPAVRDVDHDYGYGYDSASDILLADLLDDIEVRARTRHSQTPAPPAIVSESQGDESDAGVSFARRPVALGASGWSVSEEDLFRSEVCGSRRGSGRGALRMEVEVVTCDGMVETRRVEGGEACEVPYDTSPSVIPVEEPSTTEQSAQTSTAQDERAAANGNGNGNGSAPATHENDTTPDTRTPLQRFRTRKPLSVTDLVSPSWCELQYHYTLSKFGRKPRTVAMKRGTTVHKNLEEQVHVTVPVDTKTREDTWGIRLWNCIQGLRTLRATGMTRELEVWGVLEGEVVNGVIDELGVGCPDPELEAMLETVGETKAEAVEGVSEAKRQKPGRKKKSRDTQSSGARESQTITEFFRSKRTKGSSTNGQAEASEEPTTTTTPQNFTFSNSPQSNPTSSSSSDQDQHPPNPPPKIYIMDVKTRNSPKLPTGPSLRPTHIQLMLYNLLLTRLASNTPSSETDSTAIFARYRLNPTAEFSGSLIAQLADLENINLGPEDAASASSETNGPPLESDVDAACELLAHNSLQKLWDLMMREYGATFAAGEASVGKVLKAEFRRAGDGEIMGARVFPHDEVGVRKYVGEVMRWWRGEREPRGVPVEEAYKCGMCDFSEGCEWRIERVEEAVRRSRERVARAGS